MQDPNENTVELDLNSLALECPLIPVLTVSKDWHLLEDLARELNLKPSLQFTSNSHRTHLICEDVKLDHKSKTLNLFGFAIAFRLRTKADLTLWQHSEFRHDLESQIKGSVIEIESPKLIAGSGFSLHAPLAIYLNQAGFSFEVSGEYNRVKDSVLRAHLDHLRPQLLGAA